MRTITAEDSLWEIGLTPSQKDAILAWLANEDVDVTRVYSLTRKDGHVIVESYDYEDGRVRTHRGLPVLRTSYVPEAGFPEPDWQEMAEHLAHILDGRTRQLERLEQVASRIRDRAEGAP